MLQGQQSTDDFLEMLCRWADTIEYHSGNHKLIPENDDDGNARTKLDKPRVIVRICTLAISPVIFGINATPWERTDTRSTSQQLTACS